MNAGRKLFYDKTDGTLIVDTGQYKNAIKEKTVDQQIETYSELSERNRDSFGVLELAYGQYAQDFATGKLIGVDIATVAPIFEYPNPENPDEPIIPEKPLSVEVDELKRENTLLKAQTQANADRADFQEEVITEIIMALYA